LSLKIASKPGFNARGNTSSCAVCCRIFDAATGNFIMFGYVEVATN
jgi:hypothetical protein